MVWNIPSPSHWGNVLWFYSKVSKSNTIKISSLVKRQTFSKFSEKRWTFRSPWQPEALLISEENRVSYAEKRIISSKNAPGALRPKCLTPSQVWGKAKIGFSKMENQSKELPILVTQKWATNLSFRHSRRKHEESLFQWPLFPNSGKNLRTFRYACFPILGSELLCFIRIGAGQSRDGGMKFQPAAERLLPCYS